MYGFLNVLTTGLLLWACGIGSADPRVDVIAPLEGQVFAPGDSVAVAVEVDSSLDITDASVSVPGLGSLALDRWDPPAFHAHFIIPDAVAGPIRIIARVRTGEGERISAEDRVILVVPREPRVEISVAQRRHLLDLSSGRTAQLRVQGVFSGDVVRGLTHGSTGTTYRSSDPAVATVDEDGLVKPVGLGVAAITIRNGELVDFGVVIVRVGRELLPPIDVTDQIRVTRGEPVLDPTTGVLSQEVRLENHSEVPAIGPLYALILDLPVGVELERRRGVTGSIEPRGTPFVRLPLLTDGLHLFPGESVDLTFAFRSHPDVELDYRLKVVRTARDP